MRVALYHPWCYLRSGVERMIVEIALRSRHDWVVFTHHFEPDATYPEMTDVDVRTLTPEVSVRRSAGPLSRATRTIAATKLPDVGARALLVSSEGLGDLVLTRNRLPAVAYCHTPLKILHDPATRQRLSERDRSKYVVARTLGPAFTAVDRILWRRYRHAFANSAEVARRLERARLRPGGEVEVLHPGVDAERFTPGDRPRRGFLVAGRIMWQKQIERAIDAYRAVLEPNAGEHPDPEELVIAGAVDAKSVQYLAELRSRAQDLPVRFVVDPSDRVMVDLLQRARALVFTAPNEDFGMVVLEALACGTPVIAPASGGPAEILTPETGWLVDSDTPSYADEMAAVLRNGVAPSMRDAAVARARDFGWPAFVDRIDDVIDEVTRAAGSREAV